MTLAEEVLALYAREQPEQLRTARESEASKKRRQQEAEDKEVADTLLAVRAALHAKALDPNTRVRSPTYGCWDKMLNVYHDNLYGIIVETLRPTTVEATRRVVAVLEPEGIVHTCELMDHWVHWWTVPVPQDADE